MNQVTAGQSLDELAQSLSTPDQNATTEPTPTSGGLETTMTPAKTAGNIDGPYNEPASTVPDDGTSNLNLIMKIPVEVQVILGTTKMPVAKLMKLGRNAVIALDRQVGDPIDVVVNGQIVARGEVVLMEDDNSRFGISLTEVVGSNVSEQ